jgi:3-hydroxyacyl-[acyl-carrier-protein] dehydratase
MTTTPPREHALELGPDVVQRLLPHRRPLLLVDRILGFEPDSERPALWATRHISANEEVFAGHFPDLHLWPGIYTVEGLGQSCHLLQALLELRQICGERGLSFDGVLRALQSLELGYRLKPTPAAETARVLAELGDPPRRVGLSAGIEMRFLEPVFAGQCLKYHVVHTHAVERFIRFEVQASVDQRCVARGVLTGALGPRLERERPPA